MYLKVNIAVMIDEYIFNNILIYLLLTLYSQRRIEQIKKHWPINDSDVDIT